MIKWPELEINPKSQLYIYVCYKFRQKEEKEEKKEEEEEEE